MSNLSLQTPGLLLASFVGLCILLFLVRRPEITFALFLFSYVIEGGDLIPSLLDLTAIFLFISFVGFLLPVIMSKSTWYSPKPSDIWLLIFLIVLFGGTYLTPDLQNGIKKAILFAIAVALPYMIVRFFFKTYKQIKVFLITILCLATGIAAILIVMYFQPTYSGGRLQFFEANPIPTATLLAVGLVIAVTGLTSTLLGKNRQIKAICIAIIPLCLYGIFLSGVRGPLISAIVGLAFYLLILSIRRPRVLISIVGIALFLLATLNIWYPYISRRLPNIRVYSLQAITQGPSTQQRLEQYQIAIRLFSQRPLLGGGTDDYAKRIGLSYPHNIFLEIISENGLIGLFIFLCFLGSIVWSGFRYLKTRQIRFSPQERAVGLTVLVVSMTLLVEKQFSGGLTMHKDLFAFLGLMVNLVAISRSSLRSNTELS